MIDEFIGQKKATSEEEALADLNAVVQQLKKEGSFGQARDLLLKARNIDPENFLVNTQLTLCTYQDMDLPSEQRISETLKSLKDIKIKTSKEDHEEKRIVKALAELAFRLGDYVEAKKWLSRLDEFELSQGEKDAVMNRLVTASTSQGISLPSTDEEPKAWHEAWKTISTFMSEGDTKVALSGYRNKVGLALSGGGFRASLYHLGVLARLAEMDVLKDVEVLSTVSGGSIVGALYYLKVKELLETKDDNHIKREDYVKIVREMQDDFREGIQKNIRTRAFSDFVKNLKMIFSEKYTRSNRLGDLYEEILYKDKYIKNQAGAPRHVYMDELLICPKGQHDGFGPRNSNWRRNAKVPVLLLNATSLNSGHNWHFTASFMGEPPGMLTNKQDRSKYVEVDKNARYRRVRYEAAPEDFRKYRLGYAVAASACVPGLFEPLTLKGLYPNTVVRLVDGGVYDNQGVAGLLDERCRFIFCSDASGQMHDDEKPSDAILSVLPRSSSIITDRVREEQYEKLRAWLEGKKLQGLFFVHLKKDFPSLLRDWSGCQHCSAEVDERQCLPYGVTFGIQKKIAGIRTDLDSFSDVEVYSLMASGYLMAKQEAKAIQNRYSKSGKPGKWGGYDVDAPCLSDDKTLQDHDYLSNKKWTFLELKNALKAEESRPVQKDFEKQLELASSKAFKIWKLDKRLKYGSGIIGVVLLFLIWECIKANCAKTITFTVGALFLMAVIAAIPLTISVVCKLTASWIEKYSDKLADTMEPLQKVLKKLYKWLFFQKAARNIAKDTMIALLGFVVFKIHLSIFDGMFLKYGKLNRLFKKDR